MAIEIDDAISGLVNFRATPELRIGYAYDHTTSNIGPFNSGSHEIFVLYDLDIFNLNMGYHKSPRFFLTAKDFKNEKNISITNYNCPLYFKH